MTRKREIRRALIPEVGSLWRYVNDGGHDPNRFFMVVARKRENGFTVLDVLCWDEIIIQLAYVRKSWYKTLVKVR